MRIITKNNRIIKSNNKILDFSDVDASAFISAAGITNPIQQNAYYTLVNKLKSFNLWNRFYAFYPFLGGNSNSHKWNGKDVRDLDAAYRLTFIGGLTHSNSGILFDGVTSYANTHIVPFSLYSGTNNTAHGFYENVLATTGVSGLSGSPRLDFIHSGGSVLGAIGNAGQTTFTAHTGMIINSRISNISNKLYINNSLVNTQTATNTAPSFVNSIYYTIGASGGFSGFSNFKLAFYFLSTGLTDTDALNLYNIVQEYQTKLNRQV